MSITAIPSRGWFDDGTPSMTIINPHVPLAVLLLVAIVGCSPPTPTVSTAPPAPPQPVVQTPPPPPPPAPEPDPFEAAMNEVSTILKRSITIYSEVRDEKTADKAVGEIDRMKSRMRELATEISKMPYRPGHTKHALAFQTELAQLQTSILNSPDLQRVLAEPELQLKLIAAYQSFATELIPLGLAIAPHQSAPQQQPAENQVKP
jgi:hypothetical protein